jgi:hypothetical protein
VGTHAEGVAEMSDLMTGRITRWREVAQLLEQGWRVEGFDLVSPAGERRSAWGNAIAACRKRGLIQEGAAQ